jgi:hypothetical protein
VSAAESSRSPPSGSAAARGDGRAAPAASERAREKRRRKRKPKGEADTSAASGRPPFALGYPDTPQIRRLLEAFSAGNFDFVRRESARLAGHSSDSREARAAQDLRRRLSPDPSSMLLWALGIALALFLFGYYVAEAGP